MPKMFVVTDQVDLEAVAGSVLKGRLSAATRTQALDAIRRANPGLDLDRLHPGEVLVIPTVPGTRPAADDPLDEPTADLVGLVREGMDALVRGLDEGEATRAEEGKLAQGLFRMAVVKELAGSVPEIAELIASVRATTKQDDADAARAQGELRSAIEGWTVDLDILRELL